MEYDHANGGYEVCVPSIADAKDAITVLNAIKEVQRGAGRSASLLEVALVLTKAGHESVVSRMAKLIQLMEDATWLRITGRSLVQMTKTGYDQTTPNDGEGKI